jgi:hypothetical protein
MTASILEQLHLLEELVATDQKTVDAIGARLRLVQRILKEVTAQIEAEEMPDVEADEQEQP